MINIKKLTQRSVLCVRFNLIQLIILITDVGKFKAINSNHQIQCPNLKFKGTTNYANCTNHLVISIRVISAIRSCSKFKPQCSKDKKF